VRADRRHGGYGRTLCQAAQALKDAGAVRVVAYITHPCSRRGDRAHREIVLDELVVTDTIPLSDAARACNRIRQLTVAGLLARRSAASATTIR